MTTTPLGPTLDGVVSAFDDAAGLGTVSVPGGRDIGFHCTQIADGTRAIATGTAVTFAVVPGRRGQWQAAAIRPRSASGRG